MEKILGHNREYGRDEDGVLGKKKSEHGVPIVLSDKKKRCAYENRAPTMWLERSTWDGMEMGYFGWVRM